MSIIAKLLEGAKCSFLPLWVLSKYARVNNYVYHHNLVLTLNILCG